MAVFKGIQSGAHILVFMCSWLKIRRIHLGEVLPCKLETGNIKDPMQCQIIILRKGTLLLALYQ